MTIPHWTAFRDALLQMRAPTEAGATFTAQASDLGDPVVFLPLVFRCENRGGLRWVYEGEIVFDDDDVAIQLKGDMTELEPYLTKAFAPKCWRLEQTAPRDGTVCHIRFLSVLKEDLAE